MQFWSNGKKLDTETMSAKEKIQLLSEVESEIQEITSMIAEFNQCSDLREFSKKHFGSDGDYKMYTDRVHVADFLEWKLSDYKSSDRVKALRIMGVEVE